MYTAVSSLLIGRKNLVGKAIEIIRVNLSEIGLSLKLAKNVLLHINGRGIKPGFTKLSIGSCEIASSASTRFLGVFFITDLILNPTLNT